MGVVCRFCSTRCAVTVTRVSWSAPASFALSAAAAAVEGRTPATAVSAAAMPRVNRNECFNLLLRTRVWPRCQGNKGNSPDGWMKT